ncbi:MAG TPA: polysaccharide deacetylase family protein [Actinomycetota bacterium]|nr:polysaccharide deacetylase family protein [Actinomycetota bacterium]
MMRRALAHVARRALGAPSLTRVAGATAAARRRALVLVFHRVAEEPAVSTVVVPTVPRDVVGEQISQLLGIGTVVSLSSLVEDRSFSTRPRFALTFDDDSATHHATALPLLLELGVTATFFVSGRALRGLGAPWFDVLDALIRDRGADATAALLGLEMADPQEIAAACERDRELQRLIEQQEAATPRVLGHAEIRDLHDAGMSIGFHTVHHQVLTGLPEDEVDAAAREGRAELEAVIGERLHMFAYPHGKADHRVARRIRLANYDAAWTGRPRPVTTSDDPYLLGRWESGTATGGEFAARVVARMNGVGRR